MAKQDVSIALFYSGVWNDHTSDVLVRDGIEITHGRADESGQPAPTTAKLTFTGWQFNPRNASSPLFGLIGRNTPLRITFPTSTRFVGEVASWTPRQSLGGPGTPPDRWVDVQAAGVSRRLGQGADPLQDTVARFVNGNSANLVGYWPLTDPQGSTVGRSGVGGPSMRPVGDLFDAAQFGQGQLAVWLPRSAQTSGDVGAMRTTSLRGASGGWVVDFMYRTPAPGTWGEDWPQQLDVVVRDEGDGSNSVAWRVNFIPADEALDLGDTENVIELLVVVTGSPPSTSSVTFPDSLRDGQPHHIRIRAFEQAGAAAALFVDVDGVNVDSVINSDIGTTAIQPPTQISFEWTTLLNVAGDIIATRPVIFGQVAMWTEPVPGLTNSVTAYFGHQGEHAGRRVERLTDEEGIPFVPDPFDADLDDTQLCGPQYPDGLLAVLREAAEVDRGILFDNRVVLTPALTYRTGRSLYGQDVLLSGLDYDQGQVAPPLDPTDDDQATRNDITVQRRDGGSVRATLDEGKLSTQPPPDGAGRVSVQVTVNTMSDGLLGDQAGWRLHVGTADETRFPQVSIDLDASPEKLVLAEVLSPGDRLVLVNLPPELNPDLANLLVQGYTETIGSHRRKLVFNCTPEAPYHISEVEHPEYAVIGSDGTTTDGPFVAGTDTALPCQRAPGHAFPGWTVADGPVDVLVAGVRLHVTAVVPGIVPFFDLTVDQVPVNGVVKTVPSGSRVDVFHKSYIGL